MSTKVYNRLESCLGVISIMIEGLVTVVRRKGLLINH